jgi:hypothetical protein
MGRRTTIAYIMLSKDIINIGTDTASYEVLPLGDNVYSVDSICFLVCYPSRRSDRLVFYFQRTSNTQIHPDCCTSPHCITTQNNIDIFTAMRTSRKQSTFITRNVHRLLSFLLMFSSIETLSFFSDAIVQVLLQTLY